MRHLLRLVLIASVVGAVLAWVGVLRVAEEARRRAASDRLLEKAGRLATRGDATGARLLVDQAVAADPDSPRARRELAMHLIAKRQFDAAAAELRRVAAARPGDAGAAHEMAELLSLKGDRQNTVWWLRETLRRDPKDGLTQVDLSRCLIEAGDTGGAIRAAEKAVALAPRLQSAWLALGMARWKAGDPASARAALDEALRLRPTDLPTLLCAAQVSAELGSRQASADYARRAVAAHAQSAEAWLTLADALAAMGRQTEADKALARARALQ
jgi:tetratricopeptide (TPR) repeat protein